MKTVAAGENYTTVEVDTAEVVKFSFASASLSVKVIEGEITVALRQGAQAEDDGTITVSEGETEMFNHYRMNVDTYYLTGSGKAVLHASNMVEVNPFEGKGKGGDAGGDNTHYKGTTTTALENGSTTNPIVIDGESYTAVFGDVVVYGYTEFVFDGTAWSEFGRPFDTTPTQGSTNAVTSDGIYNSLVFRKGTASSSVARINLANNANGIRSMAIGYATSASSADMTVIGKFNSPITNDLFEIGNGTGTSSSDRSNILEVSATDMNVNGDIKINNVPIPTPYTTMPAITSDMLGRIVMYVGATGGGFTQGCFYVASTDGAAEPTYSWVRIGGGRTETVLWENTGTTNPDTITLSEAWSNFDELVIVTDWLENNIHIWGHHTILNTYNIGDIIRLYYYDNIVYSSYTVTSSTVLTQYAGDGSNWISKIIGIKY